MRTPTWTLASQGPGGVGRRRERKGRVGGADLAKQVTRSRGTIGSQVFQAPGTPISSQA